VSKKTGKSLCQIAQALSEVNPEMPIQQIRLLFFLSVEQECDSKTINESLHMSSASISRSIRALSIWMERDSQGVAVQKGLDLVITRQDPFERRQLLYSLTPKGKDLMDKIGSFIC
jgi:DNA-binding MarR family transcriptional regulator